MLEITIPGREIFNEVTNEFISFEGKTLKLEHSLLSLSKWESKWNKAFLGKEEKTKEETIDYIRCMTITQNVDPDVYKYLTNDNINAVSAYIDAPMTATTFGGDKKADPGSKGRYKETVTAELIYYWMIAFNIPFECEKWHLNRLLTLVKVCNVKNTPPKKRKKSDLIRDRHAINELRRQSLNTNG